MEEHTIERHGIGYLIHVKRDPIQGRNQSYNYSAENFEELLWLLGTHALGCRNPTVYQIPAENAYELRDNGQLMISGSPRNIKATLETIQKPNHVRLNYNNPNTLVQKALAYLTAEFLN